MFTDLKKSMPFPLTVWVGYVIVFFLFLSAVFIYHVDNGVDAVIDVSTAQRRE